MKVKTSITLSEELLRTIDDLVDQYGNRSQFLETAAWAFLTHLRRAEMEARDVEILNRRADYLNAEVRGALAYQSLP